MKAPRTADAVLLVGSNRQSAGFDNAVMTSHRDSMRGILSRMTQNFNFNLCDEVLSGGPLWDPQGSIAVHVYFTELCRNCGKSQTVAGE